LLGRKPTHSYEFRTLDFISLRWLVVEISRTEGWVRKIQIRDRGVTRAIFIENGNNRHSNQREANNGSNGCDIFVPKKSYQSWSTREGLFKPKILQPPFKSTNFTRQKSKIMKFSVASIVALINLTFDTGPSSAITVIR
jgi:hypothetical protein